jgi:hypothetical protein
VFGNTGSDLIQFFDSVLVHSVPPGEKILLDVQSVNDIPEIVNCDLFFGFTIICLGANLYNPLIRLYTCSMSTPKLLIEIKEPGYTLISSFTRIAFTETFR